MNNQTNTPTHIATLKFFAQPAILQQIGIARLFKFLDEYSDDLKVANISLPTPVSESDDHFDSLASLLASLALLPTRLRADVLVLEEAAAPQNRDRLQAAIERRIPSVSLADCCPLDCALELWFAAPDEFSQFQPKEDLVGPLPTAGQSFKVQSSTLDVQSSLSPALSTINSPTLNPPAAHLLDVRSVEPWPEHVDGKLLLDALVQVLRLFVVLPVWAAETLALWIVHTFAFQLRDVSTYIGIESPEKQCGKTTLLTVLSELANRAVTASNISPPAFFRVIEDLCPTLLIDEADTFLRGNEQLKGILNAGYKRKTAFVLRAGPALNGEPDSENSAVAAVVNRFSCWCPKLISQIGRLPDTLADRCIVIRMQRKTRNEECERLRNLDAEHLKQKCARFVLDHQQQIATAKPEFPSGLSDRASDIWEPLLALADLAGGDWPQKARQAAVALSAAARETSPIASLLLDLFVIFTLQQADRLFTRTLVAGLNARTDRPWMEMVKGKVVTDRWLAQQLRPYGIQPRTFRIGDSLAKGYLQEDCMETFRRYIPKSDLEVLKAEWSASAVPAAAEANNGAQSSSSAPGSTL